jgi:mRNA interferase YafQ
MRLIERTNQFKRDYRRESKGKNREVLGTDLAEILGLLANDLPLPSRCFDHSLTGDWVDHRDCHIRPDLVLIYRKVGEDRLQLVRIGSHSELGL